MRDFDLLTADTSTNIAGIATIQFQGAPIVRSIDNTAGNTELFVHAWHAVIGSGKWINHAFILKVDPDAVFIPERVQIDSLQKVSIDLGGRFGGRVVYGVVAGLPGCLFPGF